MCEETFEQEPVEEYWIDGVIRMADSYPRDEQCRVANDIVGAYNAGVCTRDGAAVP